MLKFLLSLLLIPCAWATTAHAQPLNPENLNLEPEVVESSPVLQRWLEEIPDVAAEIRNDPAFLPRLRLGYHQFPSTDDQGGWWVGVEDVRLGNSRATVSGVYQGSWSGDRTTWGGDFRYYVRPLGHYFNVAPVVGYRHITTQGREIDGVNVGAKVQLALSRTGAADLSLQQTFVNPGQSDEVGITTLSLGYALTRQLRLTTEIEKQNSPIRKDSRVGIGLEWLLD